MFAVAEGTDNHTETQTINFGKEYIMLSATLITIVVNFCLSSFSHLMLC